MSLWVDFSSFPQLYSEVFGIPNITGKSLAAIEKTGYYCGSNISETNTYLDSSDWCVIHAIIQSDGNKDITVHAKSGTLIVFRMLPDGSVYKVSNIALKADLSDLVIEKGFQKSVDIPAGNAYSSTECDIEYTVPSGYRALAIYKGLVTNSTCCVYNTYFTGSKARLVISNLNGSQKTVTAYAFILFIKS